ncbi:MAG: transposase [Candidatus Lokiarchaeota archaeon]|nr:transposase [Candidatus Lokiarchaeota archaeon]MBD3201172.1 transposase [Candidatus Lokiarchaeota archaeon]
MSRSNPFLSKNSIKTHITRQRNGLNSLPFRKLQTYIEYKALKRGIAVKYIDPTHTTK